VSELVPHRPLADPPCMKVCSTFLCRVGVFYSLSSQANSRSNAAWSLPATVGRLGPRYPTSVAGRDGFPLTLADRDRSRTGGAGAAHAAAVRRADGGRGRTLIRSRIRLLARIDQLRFTRGSHDEFGARVDGQRPISPSALRLHYRPASVRGATSHSDSSAGRLIGWPRSSMRRRRQHHAVSLRRHSIRRFADDQLFSRAAGSVLQGRSGWRDDIGERVFHVRLHFRNGAIGSNEQGARRCQGC
jgi:hypothetical protein